MENNKTPEPMVITIDELIGSFRETLYGIPFYDNETQSKSIKNLDEMLSIISKTLHDYEEKLLGKGQVLVFVFNTAQKQREQ